MGAVNIWRTMSFENFVNSQLGYLTNNRRKNSAGKFLEKGDDRVLAITRYGFGSNQKEM
jgi:hypothetical protein